MLNLKDMVASYFGRYGAVLVAILLATGITLVPAAHGQTSNPVDVNSADTAVLATLPGITPTIAKRIIKGRPYHTLEDLSQVKGLTQAKMDALLGRVTFGTNVVISAVPTNTATTASAAGTTKRASADKVGPGEKININKATADQLTRLPGIGKAKAQAIVDYRTQNGGFKSLEDIEKVKGIKAGLFAKLKDYIKISD